ncbi:hypothetical protein [Devriesea agamarum]|uniref:hypothetical protein n=1 Tax=Devriesea agamarum TaxID=472569 RepID=UPI00071DCC06|nr:hypothetical protein [Devriesea agamarum]
MFPKSRFTTKKLLDAGVPLDSIDDYLAAVNLLANNLQLRAGTANIEKQDGLPAEWTDTAFPSEDKRATYLVENELDGLPLDLADFASFFEERKQRIRARLLSALGTTPRALEDATLS